MKPHILRSAAIYIVANVLSAGVPFLLLPILTRALTPSQYGDVVSFYMLVAVSSSLAGLGLHAAVGVRWLDRSKGDPRSYTASAVLLVLLTTALAAGIGAVLGPHLGISLAPQLCAVASVVAGTTVLQSTRFAVWQSAERPRPAAVLQVSAAVLNIALSLLAVFILQLGGTGRILGAAAAGVIIGAISIYLLRREQAATRPRMADVRSLLHFGLPLMPHTLASSLLANADRFAVSAQLGAAALGVYGTASQLGMVMNVIADAAIKAYSPTMYRLLSGNSTRCRLRVVAVTYISIPVWLMVALGLWGGFALVGTVLLGDRYIEALSLAGWFLAGGAVMAVYLNIAGLFFFTGRTEFISIATVTTSAAALLLATPAVAAFGVVGGGAAYLTAQLVLLAAAWALSCRISPMPWARPVLAMRVLLRKRSGSA